MDPTLPCSKRLEPFSKATKVPKLRIKEEKAFLASRRAFTSLPRQEGGETRRKSFSPRKLDKSSSESEKLSRRQLRVANTIISYSPSERNRKNSLFNSLLEIDTMPIQNSPAQELNPSNLFVNNIFYIEEVRAEDRFQNCNDEDIISVLHDENKMSMREAVLGYGFFITTKEFIQALFERFMSNEIKVKHECLLIFKEWYKFHKFYRLDIEDVEVLNSLKLFIDAGEKQFGKQYFLLIREELYNKTNESINVPNIFVFDYKKFVSSFKGNAEEMSKECFHSTIELQRSLDINVFDNKKRSIINDRIARANNNLRNCIVKDLIENPEKKERIKKYNFYISLGKHSLRLGDLFTCLAIFGALTCGEVDKTDFGKEPKRHAAIVKELVEVAGKTEGAGRRNALLEYKNIPVHFPHFFNELESMKEKLSPYVGQEKAINAHFVASIALFIEDLLERQMKTANVKSQAQVYDALLWEEWLSDFS